jgi:5-methylthioadenosine/S-adenosylhomocysteine deaminase
MKHAIHDIDLLIHNGLVVTMDPKRTFYNAGAVAVTQGTIVAVGNADTLRQNYHARTVLDAQGGMILPGLIDTHIHIGLNLNFFKPPQDLAQSFADHAAHTASHAAGWVQRDADYQRGLSHFHDACYAPGSEEEGQIAGEYYAMLAIKSGTTWALDAGGGNLEGYAATLQSSGLRVTLTNVSADLALVGKGTHVKAQRIRDTDKVLSEAERLYHRWTKSSDSRTHFWFNLFADVMASDELIRGIAQLAEKLDSGVYSHSGAQASHDAMSVAMFGKRGMQRLDEHGLLGPRWLGVHMGYLNEDEARLLAARGASVSHVPSTAAFYGKGIITDRTMPMLSQAGVNVVLGSDDIWNGSIIDEATRAHCFHKDAAGDTRIYPYYFIAEMLTCRAAAALRRAHELGSLEVGKRADVIVVDTDQPKYLDPEGPLQVFIKRGASTDVSATVIDGQVLMRDRQLTTIDEAAVKARLRAAVAKRWS